MTSQAPCSVSSSLFYLFVMQRNFCNDKSGEETDKKQESLSVIHPPELKSWL